MPALTYAQAKSSLDLKLAEWKGASQVDVDATPVWNTGYDTANTGTVTLAIRNELILYWSTKGGARYTFKHGYSASVPSLYDFKVESSDGYKFNWHVKVAA